MYDSQRFAQRQKLRKTKNYHLSDLFFLFPLVKLLLVVRFLKIEYQAKKVPKF